MPRPVAESRAAYYSAAVLDRASTLAPIARLRERLAAAKGWELDGTAPDGLPLPPARLRVLVSTGGGDPAAFLSASARTADVIRNALAEARVELAGSVLDFGCGCGRTARQWAGCELDLHGCDYNLEMARWCRDNLPFMETRVNEFEPPLSYPDARFDLVYAISVLTHLTERVALAWVREWARILKPGGVLLFTVHGDAHRAELGKRALPRYDSGEMVVKHPRVEGLNACVANHPYQYVTGRLLDGFSLLLFRPAPQPPFRQDVYVAKRV